MSQERSYFLRMGLTHATRAPAKHHDPQMCAVAKSRPRRVSHAAAADILATRDPVLGDLIAAGGPIRIGRRTGSHFAGLVEAIVYQQLAGAAARAIHGRLVAALHDDVDPETLLALSDEALRAAGLSA